MTDETELSYAEVLEYLADREGETVTVSSHPTFSTGEGGPSLLGLTLSGITLAKVNAVKPYEDGWLEGRAGARIHLSTLDEWAHVPDDGLVLTLEWFGGAYLDGTRSVLRIIVRANPEADPLYQPIGEEHEPREAEHEIAPHDLIGWGFTFDFDGDPPASGRWAKERES